MSSDIIHEFICLNYQVYTMVFVRFRQKYELKAGDYICIIMNGVKTGVERLIHKLENKELITTKDWRDCFKEMDDARNTCGILEGLTDFSR